MTLPKYVRLQGREISYITKKPVGIWTVCWRRIKEGVCNEFDKSKFIEADKWFVENLPYPPFYGENNDDPNANIDGAICYFTTFYANKNWERFEPIFELLDKYQTPYDIIYTNYPGKIVYQDDFQVGVIDDN
jgi:hypothetical protein